MDLFDQVTRTKILLPRRRPDLLSRQRLLDLLSDFLEYKLVIVAAPAGYGKTSLLVDLAHQTELPTCWYALDALDRDLQRFLAHFIAAVAQRFPGFGQRSWAALQNETHNQFDLERLVTTIVNEAYEHIREHFVIVLDDYHFVDDIEDIGYFVNQFIQQMDENCHLFIASRSLLTLPDLPLMVARSQVSGLSFEELAFRADEIQSLVLQNHHITLPESEAAELERETEGWITGLLLSTQTMWRGMTDRLRVARVSGVGLYDYLAQQVLDQQPAPVRDFLLRTSHFEEFDAELCEAVLGQSVSWQDLIEAVLRSNLFVLLVGDKDMWLRYHHLFRDFLQAKLAEEQPDEKARILRRLAAVHAERRQWEKAHDLYWQLGDVTSIAELIEKAGSTLVKSGRFVILGQWLDALPIGELTSRPTLLSLRGMVAQMQGEVDRGLALQNQAVKAFRETGDLPKLAHALADRAVAHRFLGKYQASLSDAEEVLTLAAQDESLREEQAEALRAKGMSLYQLGNLNEAIKWLQQSLTAYESLDDAQRVAMLRMELGMAYMSAGQYGQALVHNKHALDYWKNAENLGHQANLLNNLGVLHYLIGDYEHADSLLEEALDCAQRSGYTRIEAAALASIGDLYADLDSHDAALDAYYQAYEIAQRIDDRFLLLYIGLAEAGLARIRGELTRARELLGIAKQLTEQSNSDLEQGLYQLEAGRLALDEGDTRSAIALLDGAAKRFDNGGQRLEGAQVHLYLALAYDEAKDERARTHHLARAFELGAKLESQHPIVVPGRELRGWLNTIQNDPMVGRRISQLLSQIAEFEQDIPTLRRRLRRQASAIPFGSPKLKIRALGGIEVTVNGEPVTNSDWQGQAARDLFFFLLTSPDGLSKEMVGSTIWPESSPGQLKLKFKNAIYRLRQAIGPDVVLFEEDRYQFNRALDYEYDVEVFLGKLTQAQATADSEKQTATLQSAVHVYRGLYLPEADGEWAWWERERLRQAHLEAIVRLAELHLEAGNYALALDYCQLALTEDSCLEEAHRLAMRAHAGLGNRAAVVRQYERCQQVLREEVDAPPSSQTVTLYETLIR